MASSLVGHTLKKNCASPREGGQARRDVHLDADERRFHADQGRREHARQHGMIVGASGVIVNVTDR